MNLLSQLKSQMIYISSIRSFLPFKSLLREALVFPIDYYLRAGRSSSSPLNINFLLTSRCNLKCEKCFFKGYKEKIKDTLTLPLIEKFVKSVAYYKPSFFLTGGEPFVRKDIINIVKIIKRYKLKCGICTNGTLLNKETMKDLIKLKLNIIFFSLRGPEKIHDEIAGVPGSFQKLMENLTYFCKFKEKTKVFINCYISEKNLNNLEEVTRIGELARVDAVRFEYLYFLTKEEKEMQKLIWKSRFPNLKSYFIAPEYNPPIGMGKKVLNKVNELKKKRYSVKVFFKPNLSNDEIISWYSKKMNQKRKCLMVYNSIFIGPNGDIYPCQYMFLRIGNILDSRIEKIWNDKDYINLRRELKKELLPLCKRCCKL